MPNQLFQVFRTYYTRRDYWLFLLMIIPSLGPFLAHSNNSSDALFAYSMPIVLINIMIGFIVGMQVKLHFASPRAKLLPGFSKAHLLVPAAIVTIVTLVETIWFAPLYRVPSFAVGAFALMLMTLTAWNAYIMRGDCNLVFMVFMFGGMFAPKYFVTPFLTSGISVSMAVFCVGLVGFVGLGIRLLILSEEMPEYGRVMPGSMWDFISRSARRDRGRLEAQMIARSRFKAWLMDFMFNLVFRKRTTENPPSRLLLRQLSGGFAGVYLGLSFIWGSIFAFWFQSKFPIGDVNKHNTYLPLFFFAYLSVMMITSTIGGLGMRRWQYLIRESLTPISRRDFAKELIQNSGKETAIVSCGLLIGFLLGFLIFYPQTQIDSATLLLYFITTIGQYFLTGWAILYVVSYRSFLYYTLAATGLMLLSMILIAAVLFSSYWFLSWAAIMATIVLIMGFNRLAYRRWCNVDLD